MKSFFTFLGVSLAALLMSACKQDVGSLNQLRQKIDEIEPQVVALKHSVTKLKGELERAKKEAAEASESLDTSMNAIREMETTGQNLAKEFNQYRDDYRESILKRAAGIDLGSLTIGTTTYSNVRVKSVDAWDLSFQHAGGIGRVALRDLPSRLQDMFAFNPNVGPKPPPPIALGPIVVVDEPVGRATAPSSGSSATPVHPQPVGSGSVSSGPQGSSSGSKGDTYTLDVLARWGNAAGGGGGSKVKGATAPIPQGYRPIGSSFSGSAMDRNRNAEPKH